jgi:hypothetical protein
MMASMETECLKILKLNVNHGGKDNKIDSGNLLATSHHPLEGRYFTTIVLSLEI